MEGFRPPIIYLSNILPLVVLFLDFFLNRVVIAYKHLIINLILTFVYFFATYIGQLALLGRPIYKFHLSWF